MSLLSVLLSLSAFLFGIFTVWKLFREKDFDEEKVLDLVAVGILGGLMIGRGVFVFLNWPNYVSFPLGILNIFDGGINLEAAILSFLLFAFCFLLFLKWPFFPSLDFLALGGVAASAVLLVGEVIAVTQAGFGEIGIYTRFLLKFLLLGAAFLVFKKYYRRCGVLTFFLFATLRPFLILTGILSFGIVNIRDFWRDFREGFQEGFQIHNTYERDPSKIFTTRRKTIRRATLGVRIPRSQESSTADD